MNKCSGRHSYAIRKKQLMTYISNGYRSRSSSVVVVPIYIYSFYCISQ